MRWFQALSPREDRFFDRFTARAQVLVRGAEALRGLSGGEAVVPHAAAADEISGSASVKLAGVQYAALPYRIHGRRVQVMLITSRGTGRWVIPKGWPMDGLSPQEAALTEAAEEAGVVGAIADRPIGSYRYIKQFKRERGAAVQVIVFPLLVEGQALAFKEQGQRRSRWFPYQDAAGLVAEPSLGRLIREFGAARTPNLLMRTLRGYREWRVGLHA
jgi:8-oxo-dGTP pyrophosphatase MutT (NUDIX family)